MEFTYVDVNDEGHGENFQDAEIAELQAALGTATTVSYVAIILAILLGIVSIAMARKK